MPSEQDNTALAAIIIAIIAFFVTTAQLLQQIFGTAVGYRHCQASVIGEWATLTRRKWRWGEFKFETRFTTPNIRLVSGTDYAPSATLTIITGDAESRRKTYVRPINNPDSDRNEDRVGWLELLDHLHLLQRDYGSGGLHLNPVYGRPLWQMSWPAITLRERSWDFIPPNIVRPVATSTVGDIIVLAHRLGMAWTDLRPADGIMRAEGRGRSIISTTVRGFGMLLLFKYDRVGKVPHSYLNSEDPEDIIPSAPADKLGFGIIDCLKTFGRYIVFEGANETEAAKGVMHALHIDSAVIDRYGAYMEQFGNSLGFSDILGMLAPFMPFQASSVTAVMKVHRDVDHGPTCSLEGFVVFRLRLEKYEKEGVCSEQMLFLLSTYRRLKEKWQLYWEPAMHGHKGHKPTTGFTTEISKLWGQVTDSLSNKHSYYVSDFLFGLVASHITQAVEYPELAKAALNDTAQRQKIEDGLDPFMDRQVAAGMHLYIDRIPLVVLLMQDKGYHDERSIIDTWWTLIFRAMLWHRGHRILKGKTRGYGGIPVSPTFWESKSPVYIA